MFFLFMSTPAIGRKDYKRVLAAKSIVAGVGITVLNRRLVTRAEFAKMLVEALNLKKRICGTFGDVSKEACMHRMSKVP